ncbi:MAG TPA: hypothetical protein VE032_04475 [Actinomycetota bacterium]|nr:hypothetical protein [Actinomycetota bacterium]
MIASGGHPAGRDRDRLRRCRLHVGPGTTASLDPEGIEILGMPGVLRVIEEHDGALTVDFDPRRLPISRLVAALELAHVIRPTTRWGVEPHPVRSIAS